MPAYKLPETAVPDPPRKKEAVLIAKTNADRVEEATARIKALHSYDVPCVVALPLVGGNEDFLAWIASETAAGG